LRKKVEKEIATMLKNDIIEEINKESTPWVSPIVTPPKTNGDVRICVDMRMVTDHKPLAYIWKKTQPPLRIERWGLRLQPYKMNIIYKPGKDNPSDYLSRHPLKNAENDRNLAEEYVNFITEKAVPNA